MVIYWKMLGRYSSETTSYTPAATNEAGDAGQASIDVELDGRLVGLRVMEGAGAATSLTGHVQWKLVCTIWQPNTMEVGVDGRGIQTAPAFAPKHLDFVVDQPVQTDKKIKIEARNNNADTPVTVDAFLYGKFEA